MLKTSLTYTDLDRAWELLIPKPTQMVQGQALCRERLQVGIRREMYHSLSFFMTVRI